MDGYRSKSYGDGRMEIESYHSANNYNTSSNNNNNNNNNNSFDKNNYVWENPNLESSSTTTYSNNYVHNNNGYSYNGVGSQDLRCYSASYATTQQERVGGGPRELRKGKSTNNNGSSSSSAWCFGDPEMQRKKRVASYKSYSVEGKLKRSFSKSFKWVKDRCSHMVHGL